MFGDHVSGHDIQRAFLGDGATVPIHYESRLVRLVLKHSGRPNIDHEPREASEVTDQAREALTRANARGQTLKLTEQELACNAVEVTPMKLLREPTPILGPTGRLANDNPRRGFSHGSQSPGSAPRHDLELELPEDLVLPYEITQLGFIPRKSYVPARVLNELMVRDGPKLLE